MEYTLGIMDGATKGTLKMIRETVMVNFTRATINSDTEAFGKMESSRNEQMSLWSRKKRKSAIRACNIGDQIARKKE